MNLYLVTNHHSNLWDIYDMLLVSAQTEADAREVHPYYDGHQPLDSDSYGEPLGEEFNEETLYSCGKWPRDHSDLKVELVGTTDREKGIIYKNFKQG